MRERNTEVAFLFDNLRHQIDAYHQLNTLEKDKQEALMQSDSQKIDGIVVQEEQVLMALTQLEADRASWAASLEIEEPSGAGFSFSDLSADYPDLAHLRGDLLEELAELQIANQTNSQLINNQLAYINFSLQSIAGDTKPMYGSPGTLNKTRQDSGGSYSFIDHNA